MEIQYALPVFAAFILALATPFFSRAEFGLVFKLLFAVAVILLTIFGTVTLYEVADGDPLKMAALVVVALTVVVASVFQMPELAEPINDPVLAALYPLIPLAVLLVLLVLLAVMRIMLRRMRETPPD